MSKNNKEDKNLESCLRIKDIDERYLAILEKKLENKKKKLAKAVANRKLELEEEIVQLERQIYYVKGDIEYHDDYLKEKQHVQEYMGGNRRELIKKANMNFKDMVQGMEKILKNDEVNIDLRKEVQQNLQTYYRGWNSEEERLVIYSACEKAYERAKASLDEKEKESQKAN